MNASSSSRRKQTRSQNVTAILREKILTGALPAHSRLQEVALAESLNVSRTPVREALRILAEDGLLQYEPNRGYTVKEFSVRDVLIAFRVRAAMEGLGCRLVAEQGVSDEQAQSLTMLLDEGEQLLRHIPGATPGPASPSAAWLEQWREMNRRFHVLLLQMADSALLVKVARDARVIPIVNQGSFRWYQPDDFRRAHEQHRMIVQCVLEGDGERAEFWMREHILQAGHIAKGALSREMDSLNGGDAALTPD